jgi:hypothetical protein
MTESGLDRWYRTLELAPGASLTEIKNAYLRLKRLYAEESPVLKVMTADFPPERRSAILAEVEEAYREVLASFKAPDETPTPLADKEPGRADIPSGSGLKRRREMRGLSLQGIYQVTKIRVEILENIEAENFAALPDESFLRNHLTQYARALGLNPKDIIEPYLERYHEWRKRRGRPAEANIKR